MQQRERSTFLGTDVNILNTRQHSVLHSYIVLATFQELFGRQKDESDRMDKPLVHVFVAIIMCAVRVEGGGDADMRCSSLYKSLGYIGQSHFFYMNQAVDWHEANRTCHSYPNTHLATFHDEYTLHVITERIVPITGTREGGKSKFWFGAHELTFEKWRWLDDQIYDGRMIDYGGDTKKTCGLVDGTNADHLAYSTCTSEKRFLCVNPDADSTNLGTDDRYVSSRDEAANWFRAREICLCRGMDLAMAKDGSVDYIYSLLNRSTSHFWIGLQKARFVWENTGKAISYLPFRPGQPDYWKSVEDCLHVFEGAYNDVHCTAKSNFICERKSNPPVSSSAAQKAEARDQPEPTKKEPAENRQQEGTGQAGITGAAVTLAVLAVVAVVALTLLLVVRRANKHSNTGNKWLRFGGENMG